MQKSGKGTRNQNFKTFQGRQGANTHHVTTSNSPTGQKPRSSGQLGIGQLNSASQNLIKMANTSAFQFVDPKAKGRNVADQSLVSSTSLNQSSYATEASRLQIIDRSMNADTQIMLDHSKDSQFLGISTEMRGRVTRPKSKSKKAPKQ